MKPLRNKVLLALAFSVALQTLLDQKKRFLATVVGVAFAVVLVAFQTSLLLGFLHAAAVVPTATKADIWVVPAGVPTVEFADVIEAQVGHALLSDPAVDHVASVVTGFARFRSASCNRASVTVVGLEDDTRAAAPWSYALRSTAAPGRTMIVDRSALAILVPAVTRDVEVNDRGFLIGEPISGFSSFLGASYAFLTIESARDVFGLSPNEASFLAVYLRPGSDIESTVQRLGRLIPDHQVITASGFGSASGLYWMARTGAGGGFLIAAVLGALVGGVFVAQSLYTYVLERAEEYALLGAIGADPKVVRQIVMFQGAICGVLGAILGALMAVPFVALSEITIVPWIYMPLLLLPVVMGFGICLATLSSLGAARRAVTQDPAAVFRS